MRSFITSLLTLLLALMLCQPAVLHAQSTWSVSEMDGVEYVKLSDVWRFYKFSPRKGRPGCVSYGSGKHVVSLKSVFSFT